MDSICGSAKTLSKHNGWGGGGILYISNQRTSHCSPSSAAQLGHWWGRRFNKSSEKPSGILSLVNKLSTGNDRVWAK